MTLGDLRNARICVARPWRWGGASTLGLYANDRAGRSAAVGEERARARRRAATRASADIASETDERRRARRSARRGRKGGIIPACIGSRRPGRRRSGVRVSSSEKTTSFQKPSGAPAPTLTRAARRAPFPPASLVATASPPPPAALGSPRSPAMPGAGGAEAPDVDARKKSHDDDEASGLQREASEEWDVVSRSELSSRAPSPRPPRPRTAAPGRRPPLARVERAPSPRRTRPRGRPRTSPAERRRRPPPPSSSTTTQLCSSRASSARKRARARASRTPPNPNPHAGRKTRNPFWLLATLRRARADAARRASNLLRALALAWSRPDAPAAEPARRRRKTTKPPASEIKKNTSRRRPPSFGDRGRGGGRNQHRHGGVAGLAVAVAIAGALARWAFGRSRDAGGPASAPPEGFAREVL